MRTVASSSMLVGFDFLVSADAPAKPVDEKNQKNNDGFGKKKYFSNNSMTVKSIKTDLDAYETRCLRLYSVDFA